jgi:endonuclease G, mitochondrial
MPANQNDVKAFLRRITRPEALEAAAAAGDFSGLEGTSPAAAFGPLAATTATKVVTDEPLSGEEQFYLEAIIIPGERPAIEVSGADYEVREASWMHFNNAPIKQMIRRAIASTGRIEIPDLPSLPYGGTGWVAGPNLLMTNRHVAQLFATGLGLRQLRFQTGQSAALDLAAERGSTARNLLRVRRVVLIHPYWDMALLEVEGLPVSAAPLSLSTRDPQTLDGQDVAVIGYPAFDPRNDAKVQNEVFGGTYNVKRLQPGRAGRRDYIESFGKNVFALTHDSSTLGGNSGSLVQDVSTGEIIALHFAGLYLKANYGVPAAELARDGRVVDAGVNFTDRSKRGPTDWDQYWTDLETVDTVADGRPRGRDGSGTWEPIEVRIRIAPGTGSPSVQVDSSSTPTAVAATEAMVEPFHDDNLGSRHGYDETFLGDVVPLPTPENESLCAPVDGDGYLLHYHHFSIVMHKRRRLALFTASNIDMADSVRRPESGKDYTRKGLSGLGPNDQEKWFTDPRIADEHQLPDVFFNKDRQAFDKGHVVRREDVAWGRTYQEVRTANGDTYHTTNCSPQVAGFNRPEQMENWGDLENYVLTQARTEKLSLFAGPVLAQDDRSFMGFDDDGPVAVQIPRSYWKVVVAHDGDALQTYAFLLRQDLSDVDFGEFAVSPNWTPLMIPIADLEAKLLLRFPQKLHVSDQAKEASGAALRASAGIELVSQGPIASAAPPPRRPFTATPAAQPWSPAPGPRTASTKTLESLAFHAHDSVRGVFLGGRGLRQYLREIDKLNPDERRDIVDQAVMLLDGYYAHLQLKKAMYGFDPVQRLRLLRRRLGRYGSEIAFHNELTDIFTNLRDLHTNYLLPDYFARSAAFLPFQVKYCWENDERIYVVTNTMPGVTDPNFQRGVRITYWNAVPIDRAVEIAASYHAGSNPAARLARGVDGLTLRGLRISAPPDDEWVIVGYDDLAGQPREFRAEWSVVNLPEEASATEGPLSAEAASALGLDLEGDLHRRLSALLYSPEKLAERQRIKVAKESANYAAEYGSSPEEAVTVAAATVGQGLQSTMPDVFDVSALNILGRTVGYLRIRTFMVNRDEPFVAEVVRLLEHTDFPKDGMILDVRGNGGGLIWAGERLLQLFTSNQIEPTRAQFAVTPLTVALSQQTQFTPWKSSLERAVETGASFSAAFPITPKERCNDIGRRYAGPVVLITDARCYSTTDMFAAGFKDHGIGKILGVDDNTGAGGANVWTIEVLRQFTGANGPVHGLPRGGDMRVAIRRTLRVGPQAGTEIEDLGVEPDDTHKTTPRDLLENDGDLLEAAVRLL